MIKEQREFPRVEPLMASFATFDRGRGMVELKCRCCGTVIGKPLPVGQQRIRRVKTQTFIETDLAFTYLANYREVEIERMDGGRHIGHACADCAEKLKVDAELLMRFAETDLAQWRSEGHTITRAMDERSRPVRVKRVDVQIKD